MIAREEIETVKAGVDLVALVRSKGVPLDFLNKLYDPKGLFAVGFNSPGEIFEGRRVKSQAFCRLRQRECPLCGLLP